MMRYKVTVTVQYPAWDERDGIVFYVEASSKAAAIKAARRENEIGGQIHREHGRATWRAVEDGSVEYFAPLDLTWY
jgi:hypothetical protein